MSAPRSARTRAEDGFAARSMTETLACISAGSSPALRIASKLASRPRVRDQDAAEAVRGRPANVLQGVHELVAAAGSPARAPRRRASTASARNDPSLRSGRAKRLTLDRRGGGELRHLVEFRRPRA